MALRGSPAIAARPRARRQRGKARFDTSGAKQQRRPSPARSSRCIRRILAENGRDYRWHYAFAIVCLLLVVAATTAFTAWIMRDVVDEIFYERQRSDLIVLICAGHHRRLHHPRPRRATARR